MIIKFTFENKKLCEQAFAIRHKVFVEEQKVDSTEEFDEFESISKHFLLYDNGNAAGTARWRHTTKGIKLERFAVLEAYRGKGLGLQLVKEVMQDILPTNKILYLHAQLQAVPLYEKAGFVKEGEIFSECNIDDYLMKFSM